MPRPVSFVYFITDQQRADYLGCAGHPRLRTPHIDAIASAGTRFDRFYVANPVCMPNRASLMTGRLTSVNGVRHNGLPLPRDANTFVDVLRAGGYATALVGKSHLQPFTDRPSHLGPNPAGAGPLADARSRPAGGYDAEEPANWADGGARAVPLPYYGFDHVDLVTEHGDMTGGQHEVWLREKLGDRLDRLRGPANQLPHAYSCQQAVRTALPEELYSTFYIRDRAVEWIERQAGSDRPFFLFVSFPDPHHPFTPPGRYWDRHAPADMDLPANFGAHRNPPPPLRWLYRQFERGEVPVHSMNAFRASPQHVREAMALTCGMIEMIDDAVGAVRGALERSGRAGDTVLVFNSDHGDLMGDHALLLKAPLHFQALIRVPFIWSDPQRPGRAAAAGLASTIDVAPTILARAGLVPYHGMQGRDLAPAFASGETVRDAVLVEDEGSRAMMGFAAPPRVRTLVTARHRLSFYLDQDWGELYDLEADPGECFNLWDEPAARDLRQSLVGRLTNEMLRAADRSPWPLRVA